MPLDPNRWTHKTQEAVTRAVESAQSASNPEVTPDHLLLALLGQEDSIVLPILQRVGRPPMAVRTAAEELGHARPRAQDRHTELFGDFIRRERGRVVRLQEIANPIAQCRCMSGDTASSDAARTAGFESRIVGIAAHARTIMITAATPKTPPETERRPAESCIIPRFFSSAWTLAADSIATEAPSIATAAPMNAVPIS